MSSAQVFVQVLILNSATGTKGQATGFEPFAAAVNAALDFFHTLDIPSLCAAPQAGGRLVCCRNDLDTLQGSVESSCGEPELVLIRHHLAAHAETTKTSHAVEDSEATSSPLIHAPIWYDARYHPTAFFELERSKVVLHKAVDALTDPAYTTQLRPELPHTSVPRWVQSDLAQNIHGERGFLWASSPKPLSDSERSLLTGAPASGFRTTDLAEAKKTRIRGDEDRQPLTVKQSHEDGDVIVEETTPKRSNLAVWDAPRKRMDKGSPPAQAGLYGAEMLSAHYARSHGFVLVIEGAPTLTNNQHDFL
jgi:hypothetical protein